MYTMDELSLPVAVNVLVQAAQKGQNAGAFNLQEAALIHKAVDDARRGVNDSVAKQGEAEEKLKQIVSRLMDFRGCLLQISLIYRSPGMPGSMETGDGGGIIPHDPQTCSGNATDAGVDWWGEIFTHLDGLQKMQQQVDEIFHSPGLPGFAQAEQSFTERASQQREGHGNPSSL